MVVVLIERPGERRPEVGVLGLHLSKPRYRSRSPEFRLPLFGICLFGKLKVVFGVSAPESLGFPALLQKFSAVLADGFQHPEAWYLFIPSLRYHQRPLHQLREHIQDLAYLNLLPRAHLFCCLQSPSPSEHRKPSEQHPLGLAKQIVAPLQRSPHAPVSRFGRPTASAEKH